MNAGQLFRSSGSPVDRRNIVRRRIGTALLMTGCLLALSVVAPRAMAKNPKTFKPFKLKTLKGEKKTWADYANKLTLVVFFYPQCPHCRISLPHMQRLYDKYHDRGLSAILINVVEQEDKLIPQYLKEHRITLPVLTGAWQPSLMRDYGLETTPTHILIDEKRTVLFRQNGYVPGDEKALEEKIAAALSAAPQAP